MQCPGCQARHLIADRLGWFGEKGSIEDFLAEHGESEWFGTPSKYTALRTSSHAGANLTAVSSTGHSALMWVCCRGCSQAGGWHTGDYSQ